MKCDVAIIGGGPAGSTVGTLLKKYNPSLDVAIFERERFPREHVGESLLPAVGNVLNELDVWDKVEAANFPVKLGAKYRWGKASSEDLFVFDFLFAGRFTDTARPGTFQGQRAATAFQVDRAAYDKILLDHAEELGCRVYQEAKVAKVAVSGDRVESLETVFESARTESVEATHYLDASGGESILRRAMNIGITSPTSLRNIAIWDYWQNAEWAEEIGVGGTYVYIMSLRYGWIWFIPLGPTRTSIGLVTSAEYYKSSGKTTEQLYAEALSGEPLISKLVKNATREGQLRATKDWSFVADRLSGANWFLVGDACGFADPILSAGLSLAQVGARQVACAILETDRGKEDPDWIKAAYDRGHRKRIFSHIRFADYWYSANEQFSELKEYCSQIAKDAGLTLDADAAFQWLGTGGFTDDLNGLANAGTFRLSALKNLTGKFSGMNASWQVFQNNLFDLDMRDSERYHAAQFEHGRVNRLECFRKGEKIWPLIFAYKFVYNALTREREILLLAERFPFEAQKENVSFSRDLAVLCLEVLEGLVTEGWVKASYDPKLPLIGAAPLYN